MHNENKILVAPRITARSTGCDNDSEMNHSLSKTLLLCLLAAILVSQWFTELLRHRQSAQQIAILQSIDAQLKKQAETTDEMVASLEEIADVIEDVHSHVEGLAE